MYYNIIFLWFLQRTYHKDYHTTKTKLHIPHDMISHVVAKKCQDILSDVQYRTYLHQWTCHPEQNDAIRARKANEILSDVCYLWISELNQIWITLFQFQQ